MSGVRCGAAAGILGLALFGLGACREVVSPPIDLLGRWTTDAPRHAGRYFELHPKTLTIETGAGPTLVYSVDRFEVDRDGGTPIYLVYYRERGSEQPQTLRLEPVVMGRTLRIQHHPEVWTRFTSWNAVAPP